MEPSEASQGRVLNEIGAAMSTPSADKVVLPSHYARHAIEPIRFAVENYGPGFLIGNIVKYPARYDAKDGHKDLAKTARYVEMLRRYEAGDPNWFTPDSTFDLTHWTQANCPLRSLGMKAPSNG